MTPDCIPPDSTAAPSGRARDAVRAGAPPRFDRAVLAAAGGGRRPPATGDAPEARRHPRHRPVPRRLRRHVQLALDRRPAPVPPRRRGVFSRAAYPYGGTSHCAGHATIGTGAFPATHGMTGNAWYDRATRRLVACAADPAATSVPFGGAAGRERYSPVNLLVPTFSDELQRQAAGSPRVVSIALKPRSAIMLGGRGDADSVVIWEEDDGTWATSDAFTKTPWADVDAFVRAHPLAAGLRAVMDRSCARRRRIDLRTTQSARGSRAAGRGCSRIRSTARWQTRRRVRLAMGAVAVERRVHRRPGDPPARDAPARPPRRDRLPVDFAARARPRRARSTGPTATKCRTCWPASTARLGGCSTRSTRRSAPAGTAWGSPSDHGVAPIPDQVVAEDSRADASSPTRSPAARDCGGEAPRSWHLSWTSREPAALADTRNGRSAARGPGALDGVRDALQASTASGASTGRTRCRAARRPPTRLCGRGG